MVVAPGERGGGRGIYIRFCEEAGRFLAVSISLVL